MPKPPSWLPFLGPPLAGVGAGLAGSVLGFGFWGALIAALVAGFIPIAAYRLWKWRYERIGR
jgi:hypothetical protein